MESIDNTNKDEILKAENEVLKMKLMLEKGALFGEGPEAKEMPPEMENAFLRNVVEFEKQFENVTYVKIIDRLGNPTHFKPAAEIPDEEIAQAWEQLYKYLNERGISLDACSPNVTQRELYRFTIEELFQQEIEDINIPGMVHGFIYDEFHPDPFYDNTRTAVEDCIVMIFQKEPMGWAHYFKEDNLKLNEHGPLKNEELKSLINRFKQGYDELKLKQVIDVNCVVNNQESEVTGKYELTATIGAESAELSGNWKVAFLQDTRSGYWSISEVHIEGIKF